MPDRGRVPPCQSCGTTSHDCALGHAGSDCCCECNHSPSGRVPSIVLSHATVQAIKASLRASADEVGRARHDYPSIHDFEAALNEINAATAPAR